MQAIVTRYIGPTDTKGARIKAACDAGSITVPYDYGVEVAHREALDKLLGKLGWSTENGYHGQWHGGHMPDGNMAWVFVPD